jgi:ribosome-associated protein
MKKLTTLGRKKLVIGALEDIKARDIQAIDVRAMTAMFDWIVIASAESGRQAKALARHVHDTLKESGSLIIGTEGEASGDWVLVDAGDVVAHVMQPAVRGYYNLEELWSDGKFDQVVNSSVPAELARARAPRKAAAPRKAPASRKAPAARKAPTTRKAPARRKAT